MYQAMLWLQYVVHVMLFRIFPVITPPLPLWLQRIVAFPVTWVRWFGLCVFIVAKTTTYIAQTIYQKSQGKPRSGGVIIGNIRYFPLLLLLLLLLLCNSRNSRSKL